MQRFRFGIILALSLAGVTLSAQQNVGSPRGPAKLAAEAQEMARTAVSDPSLTSQVTSAKPQLTLVSTGDETSLRAEAGLEKGPWLLSLKVEQPIEKGQQEVTLVDLDGLPAGSKATFKATKVDFGSSFDPTFLIKTCNDFNQEKGPSQPVPVPSNDPTYAACAEELRKRPDPWPTRIEDAEADAVAAVCADYNKTGADPLLPKQGVCTDIESTRKALPSRDWSDQLDKKVAEARKKVCEEFNANQPASWGWILTRGSGNCLFSTLKEKGPKWLVRGARDTHFSPRYFSFGTSFQHQSFEFTDKTAPNIEKPDEQSKFAVGFSTEGGRLWFLDRGQLYLGANASVTRAFKGATAAQVCQPIENTNATKCVDIALGAPEEKNTQRVGIEARFSPWSMAIGFLPRITYEFKQRLKTAQLITFFLPHETKGLNGGIELAIRNDGKGPIGRLFIGASFDVFPGQLR